jgi:hypothetical protein
VDGASDRTTTVGDSLMVTVKFTDRFGNATVCAEGVDPGSSGAGPGAHMLRRI